MDLKTSDRSRCEQKLKFGLAATIFASTNLAKPTTST